jgi:hypothetical protein
MFNRHDPYTTTRVSLQFSTSTPAREVADLINNNSYRLADVVVTAGLISATIREVTEIRLTARMPQHMREAEAAATK